MIYSKRKMSEYINSKDFKERKLVSYEEDTVSNIKDGKIFCRYLWDLEDIEKDEKPLIYVSEKPDILRVIGNEFKASNFSLKRLSNLTGVEFDYIFRLQEHRINDYLRRRGR